MWFNLAVLRTETCSVVRVAKALMGSDEIVENVVAAINGIVEIVPRKWGNVRSFHLKLLESLALPIYQALPDMKFKIEGVKAVEEASEVTEEEGAERVGEDEKVEKKKKKGRIHEVRYMDVSTIEGKGSDEDELGSDDDEDVDEGEGVENDEVGSGELETKTGEVKEDKVLEGKRLKKSVKMKVKDEDELSSEGKKEDGVMKMRKTDDSSVKMNKSGESDGRKEEKKKESGEKMLKAKNKAS